MARYGNIRKDTGSKIALRQKSLFLLFKRILLSGLILLIFGYYADGINAQQSYSKLKEVGLTLHANSPYRVYHILRIAVSKYIQDSYKSSKMKEGGVTEVDERLFSHHLNQQIFA